MKRARPEQGCLSPAHKTRFCCAAVSPAQLRESAEIIDSETAHTQELTTKLRESQRAELWWRDRVSVLDGRTREQAAEIRALEANVQHLTNELEQRELLLIEEHGKRREHQIRREKEARAYEKSIETLLTIIDRRESNTRDLDGGTNDCEEGLSPDTVSEPRAQRKDAVKQQLVNARRTVERLRDENALLGGILEARRSLADVN